MAVSPLKSTYGRTGANSAHHPYRSGSSEFYAGGRNDQRRLNNKNLSQDIADMMTSNRHKMMLGDSRYIYQSFSSIAGAVKQKANYVYGGSWRLQSLSSNTDFALAVEEDFKKLDMMFDIRGSNFGFRKNIWRGSKLLDVDGDFFVILTEQPETGFPKLQFLEAHRVGDWGECREGYITDNPAYNGRRILTGVIVDDYMAPVAYRVKDDSRAKGFQDIPANSVVHFTDMEWFSQGRGTPTIAAAILDWYDLSETRDAQKMKQKINSILTLVESTESGTRDIGRNALGIGGGSSAPATTYMDSGMIRIIKNGGSLKAHTANDPPEGWMKFTKLVEQSAFYALGWRREMLDSSEVGGAGVRGFSADINKSIAARRETLESGYKRCAQYIIAKRAKMGVYKLPTDWWKVSFTKPAEFTVDEGRMRAADIEDLRSGLITATDIVERRGAHYDDVVIQRAKELAMLKKVAEEYGHDVAELAILTKPGDIPAKADESEESEEETEHKKAVLSFETLKAKVDSYGVAVRAGSITPQADDETAFRNEAGFPSISPEVKQAWIDDGGYRRPITLQSGSESQADINESETKNPDTQADE